MTFDTYADALQYMGYVAGSSYFIAGHSAVHDGGGGRFIFSDDPGLTKDDGCIIEVSGGFLVRQWTGLPDPRWWGGAHQQESSAAVQSAIDKGGVYLADGITYLISARLELKDGTTIAGEGYDSVLKSTDNTVPLMRNQDKTGVRIASARFIGTGEELPEQPGQFAGHGFAGLRSKRTIIADCYFEQFSSNQIHFQAAENTSVSNNHCYDGVRNTSSDISFYAGCKIFTATNNICTSNRKQNISVGGLPNAPCTQFSIANNVCVKLDSNCQLVKQEEVNAHNILANYAGDESHASITGNVCYWSGYAGIYIAGGGTNLVVSGNQCSYNGINDSGLNLTGGIAIGGLQDGLVVDGNLVYNHGFNNPDCITAAIRYGGTSSRVTITNNIVDTASNYGILLSHFVNHANVQGNTIRKTQNHGIAFKPVNGNADAVFGGIISNNLIEMEGEVCGIGLITYLNISKRLKIENNYITNTTQANTPGYGNAIGAPSNAGILLGRVPHYNAPYSIPCTIAHNTIKGFHTGVAFLGAINTRTLFDIVVTDNDLDDLEDGYYAYGKVAGLLPIQRSYEKNVVNRTASTFPPGGHINVALMDCEVLGDKLIHHGDIPVHGSYLQGDKIFNTQIGSGSDVGYGHDGNGWISMGTYQ